MPLNIQDSRMIQKYSTVSGQVPTVAPSNDHTDGTWSVTDVYAGELMANVNNSRLWMRMSNGIREILVSKDNSANGDLYFYNNSSWQKLAIGSSGQVLTVSGGVPIWKTGSGGGGSGTVTSVNAGTNISVTGTATDPVINSLSDRYKTSSVTSNSVSNGSKSFTVDLNLSYIPLQEILVVYNPSNHMHGEVTSYNSATGALVVDIKTHTGSGTYTSWVLNLDGTPVDALSGSGTTNEIAYFTGAQILSSLAVATYPSLTELSYVKGVTSAIQTQINGKKTDSMATAKILGRNTAGTGAIEELTAIPNGITATTPSAGNNSTLIATTAFVNTAAIQTASSSIFMSINFN